MHKLQSMRPAPWSETTLSPVAHQSPLAASSIIELCSRDSQTSSNLENSTRSSYCISNFTSNAKCVWYLGVEEKCRHSWISDFWLASLEFHLYRKGVILILRCYRFRLSDTIPSCKCKIVSPGFSASPENAIKWRINVRTIDNRSVKIVSGKLQWKAWIHRNI